MGMTIKNDAKQPAETTGELRAPQQDPVPTTSGRQPSPFTTLRQQRSGEGHNLDLEYTRAEFYALVNRAVNSPPARFARAKR
jgi:hypothetical protein